MKIIIPMAGWGSRLRPHTLTVPKPMLKIAGQSITERLVNNIHSSINQKIESISFIIREDFGAAIEQELLEIAHKYHTKGYIHYQKEPLGTAHAIFCAEENLSGPLIVGFADTMFSADFQLDLDADVVIWVKQIDDPSAFGVISLDEKGYINGFVEKPTDFVSDLAIIGIYYFKDGEKLKNEIAQVIRDDIKEKGEYQLTTVLENMRLEGLKMKPGTVSQWLDFGNKNATVSSNTEVLKASGNMISEDLKLENSVIIPPCYIAEGVSLNNSIVGPFVSIGKNSKISNTVVASSIIQSDTEISFKVLRNSIIGSKVSVKGTPAEWSIGDYNQIVD